VTRVHERELIALLVGDELCAPAPGWFRRAIEPEHLVAAGDAIGELEVLGRLARVVAPHVRGLARLPSLDLRRAVSYGDVLVRLDTEATLGPATAAEAAHTAQIDALVFRAPTSGRFYGRPSPDKPAFVEVGSELAPGATVCLLEVMKTFHRVAYTGERARVDRVLVPDGADVNAGDALIALAPVS
jgi:acetyl-CoA carboxylase biotin carboxyl carrier protein